MKNDSEIRLCKDKKCKKMLPAGYKYGYCEACRNKRAQKAKKAIKTVGTSVAALASAAAVVINIDKDNLKK